MSRRPPALTFVAALCLVATALAAPLFASPAAAFGERGFGGNPVAGPGDPIYPVYAGSTLAQSFRATTTFLVGNVILRVQNEGDSVNPLAVSIHPDDPTRHVPVMPVELAATSQVTPSGGSGPGNWTFPFNPSALLAAGTTYWIVAKNDASQGPPSNGYGWVESNADTYPGGSAYMLDPVSGVWTGLPYDLFFLTNGVEYAANITAGMAANRTEAQSGDSVTFTVYFNNTGSRASPTVWVNDTLAPGLVHPTPSYPDITPVSAASFPNLTFLDVANGVHTFTITAQVAFGTPPGTVLANAASVSFESSAGGVVQRSPVSASVLVGFVSKQLYLGGTAVATKLLTATAPILTALTTSSLNAGAAQPLDFLLAPPLARPFRTTNVTASLWIAIVKVPPQTLKLNVSLLDNAALVVSIRPTVLVTSSGYQLLTFRFPALDYTFAAGHRVRLQIWSIGGGGGSTDTLVLSYNSTVHPSRLDLRTTTYVSIDELALGTASGNTTAWSPADSILARANVSDPFGSDRIAEVSIAITDPSGSVAASGTMAILSSDPSPLPSWNLYGFTLSPPLSMGVYRVEVDAREDNGVTSRAEGFATVEVPAFSFQNHASTGRARAGESFSYFLYFNNTGTGPAGSVWINDTLPPELTFVASNPAYDSVEGTTFAWALSNVTVGVHSIEIDVSVPGTFVNATVVESRATLAYTDTSGYSLPSLFSNASVILNGPELALTLTGAPAGTIHSNESVVYTIGVENAGDAARDVWLNDTLPATFVYDSDTADALGGTTNVSGPLVRFHFSDMPPATTWTFELRGHAGPALTRNASYPDTVTLDYTSQTGYSMPPSSRSVSAVAAAPWISDAGIGFLQNRTSPSASVPARITLSNQGNEAASRCWVNLTLDARLTLVNASRTYTRNVTDVVFDLRDVPVGTTVVYLNLTVSGSTPDRTVLQILGTALYLDGIGNVLPPVLLSPASVSVDASVLTLSVTPPAPLIEAGTSFPLVVSLHNWGSGSTGDVWLNVTLPSILMYDEDTSGTLVAVVGSSYSWHWGSQLPGVFEFSLFVRPREATPNGTVADLGFRVEYRDFDLRPRPSLDAPVHVMVVAPNIVFTILPDRNRVFAGGTVAYTLRIQNQGLTLAERVGVTDDIDPRLQVLSYDASVGATGAQKLTWTFADLAPGATQTINLTVRVAEGTQAGTAIPMALEANYTNSVGTLLANIRSIPVTIAVDLDLSPFAWVAAGAAAGAFFLYVYFYRRRRVEIEEVFLVYRDGVLISHLSRTLMREKDEDVLSGMLTAVQEFVREAFQYGEHRELHQLDFGEYRILIERGKYVYLAVVYSGEESPQIRRKVRTVIDRIEDQFGTALETWDGDMEQVVGARDLIRDTLLGTAGHGHNHNHNHVAKPPLLGG